ncbi:hypothetical protein BDR05DRAFT_474482 [Suillus weaverae]|nr:hypothetical protein BDR05DRAFT_474482 [Suillus weaverae]
MAQWPIWRLQRNKHLIHRNSRSALAPLHRTPHKRLCGKRQIYIHMHISREIYIDVMYSNFVAILSSVQIRSQWPFGRLQSRVHRLRGQLVTSPFMLDYHSLLACKIIQITSEAGTSKTKVLCFQMRLKQRHCFPLTMIWPFNNERLKLSDRRSSDNQQHRIDVHDRVARSHTDLSK